MANIKLPHFGNLDSDALEQYYDTNINFNSTQVQVDLNFGGETIAPEKLELAGRFIDNIRIHDINNRKRIEVDFNDEDGETVGAYIQHHLEELNPADLAELIGGNVKTDEKPGLLLKKLRLVRVGVYPEREDHFGVFDYSFGEEFTNYLVVIFTDENGNIDYITMES